MQELSDSEKLIRYGSIRRLMSDFASIAQVRAWLLECGIVLSDGQIISLEQAWQSIEYQAAHPDTFPDRKDYSMVIGMKKGKPPRFYLYKTNDSMTRKTRSNDNDQ